MTSTYVIYCAVGNLITCLILGILLYLLWEHPIRRLVEWTIWPSISHDKVYHKELFIADQMKYNTIH